MLDIADSFWAVYESGPGPVEFYHLGQGGGMKGLLHTWAGLSGLVIEDLSLSFLFGQGWDSDVAFAQIVRLGGGGNRRQKLPYREGHRRPGHLSLWFSGITKTWLSAQLCVTFQEVA